MNKPRQNTPSQNRPLRACAPIVLSSLLGASLLLSGCFGDKAPEVSFQTIKGQIIQPADYKGQVMLVNFWATSCTTCVKEMPAIVDTYNKFKDRGFRTVAVAMSYDRPDYVLSFAQSRELPFDVALDLKGEVAKAYKQVKVTPTTYLVDKQGNIIKTYVGEPDFTAMHQLIEKNL